MPVVGAVIPAFRAPEKLASCLEHLAAQTLPVDVFVRDNSEDNILFTAAVNEGIRHFLHGEGEAILLLNQDMYLEPDCVERLWRFMQANPKCGIAGPVEAIAGHPDGLAYGGGLRAFPWGQHRVEPEAALAYDEKLHWINGACLLLRREMVEEIGLLDRNMAFSYSDVDYCFTARARGWQVWRVGAARGRHEQGASFRPGADEELERRKAMDMFFFARKWLTGDLYRKLSWEGGQLTPEFVADQLRRLKDGQETEI